MQQNSLDARLAIVMPTIYTADQSKPYKKLMAQKWYFMVMFMMMPAHMHVNLQKRTDIHSSIRLMILMCATGQGTIAMEIVQELPTVDYILGTNRRRRTGHRCFHTCQDAESKDQSQLV